MQGLGGLYDRHFYEVTTDGSYRAAQVILRELWRHGPFNRVIDVGCGIGTWLHVARSLGANSVTGVEGSHLPKDLLLVPEEEIIICDLSKSLRISRAFDLCLCLEVAEHLPPERAESFVEDLVQLSPIVAFSGAIPYQGGDGHFNETWPETWCRLFGSHGYSPYTGLRDSVWNVQDIPWWYRQNIIVYAKDREWSRILGTEKMADPKRLTAIHPESYLWNVRRKRGELRTTYGYDLEIYYDSLKGPTPRTSYGPEFPAPRPQDE